MAISRVTEGETFEEFIERVIVFQILKKGLDRDARPLKDGRAAKNIFVDGD
jgi:hypothetical protein